jgi:competence protein ComGC
MIQADYFIVLFIFEIFLYFSAYYYSCKVFYSVISPFSIIFTIVTIIIMVFEIVFINNLITNEDNETFEIENITCHIVNILLNSFFHSYILRKNKKKIDQSIDLSLLS